MAFSTISTLASTLRNSSSSVSKPPYSGPFPPSVTYQSAQFYFRLNGNTNNTGSGTTTLTTQNTSFQRPGSITDNSLFINTTARAYVSQFLITNAANQSGSFSMFWYRQDPWGGAGYWPHIFDYNMRGSQSGSASVGARIALQNANSNRRFYFLFGSNGSNEQFVELSPQGDELANERWTHIVVTWQINSSRVGTCKILLNGNVRGTITMNNFGSFETLPAFPNSIFMLGSQTFATLRDSNITSYFAQVAYFPNKILTKDEIDAMIYVFLP